MPRPVSIVLLAMAVLVAAGAAPATARSTGATTAGSHDSRARAEFRAPASAVVVSRSLADTDPPFMCHGNAQAPVDDWD